MGPSLTWRWVSALSMGIGDKGLPERERDATPALVAPREAPGTKAQGLNPMHPARPEHKDDFQPTKPMN